MERKKLVYNAIQDLWKIASKDYADKSIVDMKDDDWQDLISAIDDSAKKYQKLRPEESAFYSAICSAFVDLVEHEVMTEIEVPNKSPAAMRSVWVNPKTAKEHYNITVPERKPNI